MKKILLLFSLLIFTVACVSTKDMNKQVYIYGLNLTVYTQKGFMFTPEKYTGKYESIGILTVEIYPKIKPREDYSMKDIPFGVRADNDDQVPHWFYEPVTYKEVLDSLYNLSSSLGANAVINLNIYPKFQYRQGFQDEVIGVKVSGFAIKRLDN